MKIIINTRRCYLYVWMSITLKLDYLASRNYEDREFDPYYCPSMKCKYLEYEDSTYRKQFYTLGTDSIGSQFNRMCN